jgi:hypothetical protein
MENRLLVRTQQHEIGNRSFNVEVYKGASLVKGHAEFEGKKYNKVVEIKAFSIIVRETTTDENGTQTFDTEYFISCTSRGGEFDKALRLMKDCRSLDQMRYLMISLEDEFSVAMRKDAERLVKKYYKLFTRKPAKSHRQSSPLPQTRQ